MIFIIPYKTYREIPDINPGSMFVQKAYFWGGVLGWVQAGIEE